VKHYHIINNSKVLLTVSTQRQAASFTARDGVDA
jgi:hypothetical protein